ncbi:MAG TPA: hypothetical protein VHG91_10575 [Longimicrobium sp.]|nr:hypothetical protein [Longimicrobium sp.]
MTAFAVMVAAKCWSLYQEVVMSFPSRLKALSPLRSATLGVATVLLVAGCSDVPLAAPGSEDPPVSSRAPARGGTPIQTTGPMGLHKEFYDIAGRVPGFAGVYYDSDGIVNVMLVDRKQNGLARREVSDLMQRTRGRALGHMKVSLVKYDFRQLYRWKEMITGADPGVRLTMIGICEQQNRVCMDVRRGGGLAAGRDLVARLGIPADAVRIEELDPVSPAKLLTDRFSPVPGGVRISILDASFCTIGFNARYFGTPVFLTNSHCTPQFGVNDPPPTNDFGQPFYDRVIGEESYDPATFSCKYTGYACRYSDAAEVTYYDTVAVRFGVIARPYYNSTTIDPTKPEFRIVGERVYPYAGESVSFVGHVSGWREGPVSYTCHDYALEGVTANGRPVLLLCQAVVSVVSQKGDSGAPFFHRILSTTSDVYLGGLLNGFSGTYTFYSPMRNIEAPYADSAGGDGFGDYQTTGP